MLLPSGVKYKQRLIIDLVCSYKDKSLWGKDVFRYRGCFCGWSLGQTGSKADFHVVSTMEKKPIENRGERVRTLTHYTTLHKTALHCNVPLYTTTKQYTSGSQPGVGTTKGGLKTNLRGNDFINGTGKQETYFCHQKYIYVIKDLLDDFTSSSPWSMDGLWDNGTEM